MNTRTLYLARIDNRYILCYLSRVNDGGMYEFTDPVTGACVGSVGRDRVGEFVRSLDSFSPSEGLRDQVGRLTDPGDTLQSAASRMAEWVLGGAQAMEDAAGNMVPYEVTMAALEAKDAVDDWTAARRG